MSETLKCERCEIDKDAKAKAYNPHTPGYPDKVINLCDKCADKDPKATLKTPVEVPEISPAVPEAEKPIETVEFGPKESNAPSITTPQNAPPQEEPRTENTNPLPADKPVSTEPIDRQEIRDKLAKQEKDLNSALESRRRLLAQVDQVNAVIAVKKGAIASYRDLLGNED